MVEYVYDYNYSLSTEFDTIQKEIPLAFPPKPPQKRKWRGSIVAPFAGNNMLVLYRCPAPDKARSKHFVQVLHNEHPIPMPVSFWFLMKSMNVVQRLLSFTLDCLNLYYVVVHQ